jgi:hypothetical protein
MSIEAQVVGGPLDGRWVALPDPQTWFRVVERTVGIPGDGYVEMLPTLTKDGWRLEWPRPS